MYNYFVLQDITGLENCVLIEKLYLYENKISKIQNLQMLSNLQVLWLNNNCIRAIEVNKCGGVDIFITDCLL